MLFMPLYAADWWAMPTICRPSQISCYDGVTPTNSKIGYDAAEWDAGANCRGMKMICPNAILPVNSAFGPTALSKADIASKLNPDFDIAILDASDGCFGMRKTRNNGTQAMVTAGANASWVNVYCHGVLGGPDEIMPSGEIRISGAQPECRDLADDGYIGVLNGSCYGKFGYPATDFYVECNNAQNPLIPSKIVVLNGATENANPTGAPSASVMTDSAATAAFDRMIKAAAEARKTKAEADLAAIQAQGGNP